MKQLACLALILAFLNGCSPSDETADGALKRNPQTGENTDMPRFTIGDTEFGIDIGASSFDVDMSDPDKPTITIEIAGDRSTFDPLTVEDDSEWSWALHPPAFYLRGYPLRPPSGETVSVHVMRDDIEHYEFAIYMMEHNTIEEMDIEVIPQHYLAVSGRVDIFGDIHDFRIEWNREEAK